MNSYTIKIADYELKLRCGLTPEQLNATAKKVDDCIKLICSKSTNITKTEAAILCALEFCSMADNAEQSAGANDDQLEQLAEENKKAFAALAKMEAKLEAQKAKADANTAMIKERYEANMNAQKEKLASTCDEITNDISNQLYAFGQMRNLYEKQEHYSPERENLFHDAIYNKITRRFGDTCPYDCLLGGFIRKVCVRPQASPWFCITWQPCLLPDTVALSDSL